MTANRYRYGLKGTCPDIWLDEKDKALLEAIERVFPGAKVVEVRVLRVKTR